MIKNIDGIKKQNIIIFSELTYLFTKFEIKIILKNINILIKKLVRNQNTIIIPTYNFNFAKTGVTSIDEKYITSGYLNKYLLKKFNFFRTKKPIYNYGVIGPNKDFILNLKQVSSFGKDSIIGYLSENNGLGIGIGINPKKFSWVTIHVCEESAKVPYRFYKNFFGFNLKSKKKVSEKLYVRKRNLNLENDGYPIFKKLVKGKDIINFRKNILNITILNLNQFYKIGMKLLKKDIYSLVKNEKRYY